ncbi:restriction endonuclease subunit S [Helicobacter sp.]|uniref:restriction endonuclease subunit S n=1 Tax=Helicobacter sp. TaxID=218 RepID=UPI0025C6B91C|nr:restriction endonuclease subunit S [Helicobacter sp.]MCI5632258.1 restriction endonuclease subunit S [Helicobacter sp.]
MIRKEPKLCHTERSEVSHNTESKRDFSHSLKMTKGKQLSMTTAYKPSGIEWLGEIPKHWEVGKLGDICEIVMGEFLDFSPTTQNDNKASLICHSELSQESEESKKLPILDVKYLRNNGERKLASRGNLANINDRLILMDGENSGEIFITKEKGFLGSTLKKLKFSNLNQIEFVDFVLLCYKDFFKNNKKGTAIPHLDKHLFANHKIPLPPLQEQKEIAEFLDSKCEKIQNYIDKKQKLITLLQEKKQALINEAVCGRVACHTEPLGEVSHNAESTTESKKDFSPTAQNDKKGVFYKPSGIEYLGLIPHHWEVRKLKYIVFSRNQRKDDKDFKIGLENIESKTGKYIPTNENVFEDSGISFYKNDILFGKLRPYLAKVFLADRDGICVSEFLVLESKEAYSNFLKFLMLSSSFIDIIDSSTYGTKMPRTSWEFVGNLKIPLPPLQEQKAIAEFLDTQITKIDLAIEKIKEQITLIKEYKTSLINQAVCGRIQLKD